MKVDLLLFGIAKDICATDRLTHVFEGDSVASLKASLEKEYPKFLDLRSFVIAVNNEYATPDQKVSSSDEIAIIPPVSGG